MACHDNNVIYDSIICEKKIGKRKKMAWHVIPRHINLGPHISMS
jgi:hypothetical protein